jgi:hypothetical protein
MKRLLVLFAVLVPLSLFVAGCDSTGGSSGSSSALTAEQKKQKEEDMKKQMAGKMNPSAKQGGAPSEAASK